MIQGNLAKRVAVLAGALWALNAVAQTEAFEVRITTVPISFADRDTVTGAGRARATLSGRELAIEGEFDGLQGAATRAALHAGAARGVRGEAFAEIEVGHTRAGKFSGHVSLGRAELAALREGRVYLQIHSEAAPDGNLWGWLLPEGGE